MENEFQSYSLEEDDCCQLLQKCPPKCQRSCCETMGCCYSCFQMDSDAKKVHFAHVEYRPMIDFNMLTGNTLLTGGGSYYFPQTHQTLWPEHGSHYKPSTVISEQPHQLDPTRRSSRFLSALRARTPTLRSLRTKPHHDPTSPLPSLAQSSIEDPEQPTLTFASMYDIQSSTLTVTLKFASNLNYLLEKVHKHKLNPSVSAHLLPSKNEILQSQVVQQTNNPVFNKQFVFTGVPVSDLEEQALVFQVYHDRALIGVTKLALKSADLLGYTVCKHIEKVSESAEVS